MTKTQIKAREIIVKMQFQKNPLMLEAARTCALVAVDEILDAIDWHAFETPNVEIKYWNEVKIEIEKM
jgi:hypothetical protein